MKSPSGVTWLMAVGAWAVLLAGSFAVVHAYMGRPGPSASAVAAQWPAQTELGQPDGMAQLLVFLHPRCPCTDATLANLVTALGTPRESGSMCEITVIMSGPAVSEGCPPHLQRRLEAMGSVTVRNDVDGSIARDFGAITSGHVVWCDGRGRVAFSGGITPGRGHVGPCESLARLTALVQHQHGDGPLEPTPVYGCAIFDMDEREPRAAAGNACTDIPMCCEQPRGD